MSARPTVFIVLYGSRRTALGEEASVDETSQSKRRIGKPWWDMRSKRASCPDGLKTGNVVERDTICIAEMIATPAMAAPVSAGDQYRHVSRAV
ncbi:MAG: hypothetical protein HYR64_03270 [Fimbriimonas ginsengisoli]|uniref:Uncharacterized protein n=1 Tax=Fimbriimonas ginsengisoli TaxID=1005039 RepID=A0A931LTZ9_FIMGI|nr:hypothetical protein [Fimbriimonas ginsengisoli]